MRSVKSKSNESFLNPVWLTKIFTTSPSKKTKLQQQWLETATTMAKDANDDDDFWKIALSDVHGPISQLRDDDESSVDEQDGNGCDESCDSSEYQQGKLVKYRLPTTTATLELRSLARKSGIWSPLGADAWYASALLASLLLLIPTDGQNDANELPRNDESSLHPRMLISESMENKSLWVVLELGSGAVGLSGMACAIAVDRLVRQSNGQALESDAGPNPEISKSSLLHYSYNASIFLTDNDTEVLAQLKANVANNQHCWNGSLSSAPQFERRLPHSTTTNIQVKKLDWDDGLSCMANWWMDVDTKDNQDGHDVDVDLIIGSELVYTESTALACANLLIQMLAKYPSVRILIVQVMDRYGWEEIFLPKMVQAGASVQNIVLGTDVHEAASTMILPGGTLDRYAYGAVLIRNGQRSAK